MTWPNPIDFPEFYDPFAAATRHPQLPAGLNADDVNGDVHNGAGTNWPVWPVYFETYEGYAPIILDEEKYEVFDDCPDYRIGAVPDCTLISSEFMYVAVGGTWPDIVPPAVQYTLMIPPETAEQKIKRVSAITPNLGSTTVTATVPRRGQEARRPA